MLEGEGVRDVEGEEGAGKVESEEGAVKEAVLGKVNSYLRENSTGRYRLLAPGGRAKFADSSVDGSRILFEARAKLTERASAFSEETFGAGTNLYEWMNGRVVLIGVLPSGEVPEGGSVAGPGGSAIKESEEGEESASLPGGATSAASTGFYTEDTISKDGSRVFFTDIGSGTIYMREPEAEKTIEVSAGQAYWRGATPDGSYVIYTEGKGKNRNLYRFNVGNKVREGLTNGEADVLGTFGISEDGSHIFFVAESVLQGTTGAVAGRANLYEWNSGETKFIASLNAEEDITNWTDFDLGIGGPAEGAKSSRVTPSGSAVLFSSTNKLTDYNNNGKAELYLYETTQLGGLVNLICVSCNTNIAATLYPPHLTANFVTFATAPRNAFLTHNLSSDGDRVFFESKESFLPAVNTNNQVNVYEWEKEGTGSCASKDINSAGGCIYLISTGQSPAASYFGDASSDGSNVFFFTRQSLVGEDRDDNVDLYDAKENGGIASQNLEPEIPCESEGCRGPMGVIFTPTILASTGLSGMGNLTVVKSESKIVSKPKSRNKQRLKRRKKIGKGRKMARGHKSARGEHR